MNMEITSSYLALLNDEERSKISGKLLDNPYYASITPWAYHILWGLLMRDNYTFEGTRQQFTDEVRRVLADPDLLGFYTMASEFENT